MKKIIFMLLIPSILCAAEINRQPKYSILDLENTSDNTYKVRENFKDLYVNKLSVVNGVDNYSAQTIAGNKIFSGYTSLGSGVSFKVIKLSTMTQSTEGGISTVAHGLTGDKIIGITAKVAYAANSGMTPSYDHSAEYEYYLTHDATNARIIMHPTSSGNILDKAVTILIFYEE